VIFVGIVVNTVSVTMVIMYVYFAVGSMVLLVKHRLKEF
jgi:hypothetical protein